MPKEPLYPSVGILIVSFYLGTNLLVSSTCFLLIVIREERGPYGDPQHPYFYDEEDVWMAPGFINQFYEVS